MKGSIHEILKLCRERAGLTQQDLAKMLHVERSTIAKVETGVVQCPSYMLVKEWARATDSEEIIGMDFLGKDGVKKFSQFERTLRTIKQAIELVNFMRIKRKKEAKHAVTH